MKGKLIETYHREMPSQIKKGKAKRKKDPGHKIKKRVGNHRMLGGQWYQSG